MKLILKSISNKVHEVTVEESTSIRSIKDMLEEYNTPTLRFCVKGALLDDAVTVKDAGLEEGSVIVIIGTKHKNFKKSSPTSRKNEAQEVGAKSQQAVVSLTEAPVASAATAVTGASDVASPPSVAPAAESPPRADNPSLVDQLVAMGFEDRTQATLALRAAFMNIDRAVEYLCNGIPTTVMEALQTEAPSAPGAALPTIDPMSVEGERHARHGSSLQAQSTTDISLLSDALCRIPHFEEVRSTYQQNHSVLPVIMEQISVRHPDVFLMIQNNPAEFLTLLNQQGGGPTSSTPHVALSEGDSLHTAVPEPAPYTLALTDEDRSAVSQLVDLGGGTWDSRSALLVYMACQCNQEVAANVLFEHGGVPPELETQLSLGFGHELIHEDSGDPEDQP